MPDESNNEELRIGVYICHCGSNIAGVIDPKDVAEYASHLPGVVRSTDTLYACADSGQSLIKDDIRKYKLNRWWFLPAQYACTNQPSVQRSRKQG